MTPRLHAVRMRTNMTPHDHDDDRNDDGGRSSATPSHCARRKRPAHFPTITVGFRSRIIFLTVCTRCRKPLLANDEAARLIADSWRAANFWRVGRYVIMPDHIHLFCAPNTFPAQPLKKWIGEIGSHARGCVVVRFRFGNASIGIGSCAARSLMRKNGST